MQHGTRSRVCRHFLLKTTLAVGLALTLLAGCASSHQAVAPTTTSNILQSVDQGRAVPSGTVAADFALRDQHGAIVRLSSQRGRVTMLTFLYTHCVDVCPLIAEQLNTVLRELGPERRNARVLAVSVDPRFDTPQAVAHFVAEHRLLPEFHYLRGTQAQLRRVWQAYNVLVIPKSPDLMAHTASITLIDRGGMPRMVYPASVSAPTILHDAKRLLSSS